jgi:hypothetical protein
MMAHIKSTYKYLTVIASRYLLLPGLAILTEQHQRANFCFDGANDCLLFHYPDYCQYFPHQKFIYQNRKKSLKFITQITLK